MTDILNTPLICPVLVGRDAALGTLHARLDEAFSGHGNTLLMSGEAGLGKSRLLRESSGYAHQRGGRVLVGQCFEPDRTLPYAPFIDLLRALAREESRRESPDPSIAASARSLLELMTGLSASASGQPRRHDRMQVFAATGQLVELLLEQSPLLIAIEDIHWSDESSLDLLWQLARLLHETRAILLIGTFRSDEISPDLDAILTPLNRERLATELHLHPLDHSDTRNMLTAMTGSATSIPQATIDSIVSLSEGNPFFTEELLRTASEPRSRAGSTNQPTTAEVPLPRSIEGTVRSRIRGLSVGARETLVHAAVSGRRFNFSLLEALSGENEAILLTRMKELVEAQLVLEESADRFAFRHALVRESIYSDLLSRERQSLHREIFHWMQSSPPSDDGELTADLARHSFNAGSWQEAAEYGHIAGERALAMYAPHAAIELLGHAVEATRMLGRSPDSRILRSRGTAHETLARFADAEADFESSIRAARVAGDQIEECESTLALGQLWAGRDYSRSGEYFQRALQLARATSDTSLLANVLNRVGNWHVNIDQPALAFPLHNEALAIFETANDIPGIAATLDLLAMAHYLAGDGLASAMAGRRAIEYLREIDDRPRLLSALGMLAIVSGSAGSVTVIFDDGPQSAEDLVEESVAIAREINSLPSESFVRGLAAAVLSNAKPAVALEHARESIRIADEIGHVQWQSSAYDAMARLLFRLLDVRAAETAFRYALELSESVGSLFWMNSTSAGLALCLIEQGELDEASALIDKRLDRKVSIVTMCQGDLWLALAKLELARQRPDQALAIVDRIAEIRFANREIDYTRLPYLAYIRGSALAALTNDQEASTTFTAALDGATRTSDRPLIWTIQRSLAAFYRSRDQRNEAANARIAARAAMESFAADLTGEETRSAFLERARGLLPPEPTASPRRAAKLAFGGLTARERDVAILIAAGKSNREIGDELFTSERTAATHVSNILGKLGLKTRAQIATWAIERDLAS
ncbi:helix-turn-helix transcriptional regulator [soil metagenome]